MLLTKMRIKSGTLAILVAVIAIGVSSLKPDQVYAASSSVQGSYSAAITFGDAFCNDTSSGGVGPSYNGVGDLVWITAADGSTSITANQGDLYAPVTVHIAGKFCAGYDGSGAGSNYASDQGSVTGQMLYGGNTANTYFNVSEPASLYIGGFNTGTYRINMSLASFFTLGNGSAGSAKFSPNAWTDLNIKFNQQWSINGQSYVDNLNDGAGRKQGNPALNASPGDLLGWEHDLRNIGPDDMDRTIQYDVDRTGFTNGWDGIKQPVGNASGTVNQLFVKFGNSTGAAYATYRVVAADGGQNLCARIAWKDAAWNNGGWAASEYACAFVPYNYNLKPSVDGLNNGTGTVGSTMKDISPQIDNSLDVSPGKTTNAPDAHWEVWRIEVPPGGTIQSTQLDDTNSPCNHFKNGSNQCIAKPSGTQPFGAGVTQLAAIKGETIGAATPVGTKICYTLSVKSYAPGVPAANWRHSAPDCLTVSKTPKVQVWGGDLRTRGQILTQTTNAPAGGSSKTFGSWVEYGGFSVGTNGNFASGSGLNNGTDLPADAWNKLTFANVNLSGSNSYGMFTSLLSNIPTLTNQFIGAAISGQENSNLGQLASGAYAVGDFTIHSSDIQPGRSIIIVSSGKVTIDGNITYKGSGAGGDTFSSVADLPQVVIIANNIDIKNSTTHIDAWLLTQNGGAINTCSDVALGVAPAKPLSTALNSKVCQDQLTVNGPVAASHLYLRRTAGSDTVADAGGPGEVFNLRPDTFLWAYARASQAGKAQTVYSVEMPPRF